MPPALLASHRVPVFEGPRSRRHRDVPVWKLALQAARYRRQRRLRFDAVRCCAQFVGFPRSGHSLIGSLLDAHPRAVIAHELDAMGLLSKGLTRRQMFSLMARNSAVFSEHGRYWNGFSYTVAGQLHGAAKRIEVIGDKKGDWAARRVGKEPALLERARQRFGVPCKWILVVRHPLDNIATMSLRQGRLYDRLRIETASSAEFRAALRARQEAGEIAATALDEMIEDYRALCRAIDAMRQRVDPADWHEVHYEAFLREPAAGLRALYRFLELETDEAFLSDACGIVHQSSRRSRDDLGWSERQTAQVAEMIETFPFLRRYAENPEA